MFEAPLELVSLKATIALHRAALQLVVRSCMARVRLATNRDRYFLSIISSTLQLPSSKTGSVKLELSFPPPKSEYTAWIELVR